MKKYLLLAGVFTVCATTSAHADGWYYEDNGYSQPTYQEQGYYREEPRYVRQNQGDYRPAAPRYRQISPAEARNYRERQYTRSSSANTYTTSEDTNQIRPYIGVDVTAASMDFGAEQWVRGYEGETGYFEDDSKSLSGVVGIKFNKYISLEAFYQQSGEESHRDNTYFSSDGDEDYDKTTIQYKSYGADLIGYIPVNQNIEILAALGLAQYDFETNISMYALNAQGDHEKYFSEDKDFDSLGVRFGIGAQYNLTKHIALRGMARYVHMTDDEYIKSITEFSLGLRYMF